MVPIIYLYIGNRMPKTRLVAALTTLWQAAGTHCNIDTHTHTRSNTHHSHTHKCCTYVEEHGAYG